MSTARGSVNATAAAIAMNWSVPPENVSTVPSTVACAVSATPVFEKQATEFVVPVWPYADHPRVVSAECAVTPPAWAHTAAPVEAFVQM